MATHAGVTSPLCPRGRDNQKVQEFWSGSSALVPNTTHWALSSLYVKLSDHTPLPSVAVGPTEPRDTECLHKGYDVQAT